MKKFIPLNIYNDISKDEIPEQSNANFCKTIILPVEKEKEKEKKEIKPKEVIKRQITTTSKWKFTEDELQLSNQPNLLYDKSKQPLLYQQFRIKLSSYRQQDVEKKFSMDITEHLDVSGVIQKLEEAEFKCFYCKQIVMLLYDNVREPKQWTLERLDNKRAHVVDNVVIACLSCNLRRRTMKYERYVLTKEIQKVVKHDNLYNSF